jgi:hypothetical protein
VRKRAGAEEKRRDRSCLYRFMVVLIDESGGDATITIFEVASRGDSGCWPTHQYMRSDLHCIYQ